MVNGIRTIYTCGLNKEFSLKFCMGSPVWHQILEEGPRRYRLKCCEYNNEGEDNSPNSLSDKNETL